ncbi:MULTISPECIES: arsenate reductase ArsC [unclassified Oleiphilus]|nr:MULTISPECIES: arsenate reductase ArsC [unclassified Oleiphilus]KZY47439.1 arsenate reductase [Oleiphilus sp. HI0050]KZY82198.1 arsenate reductase [Oleiphilus sp. HI0068]KZY84513.1 arsenate reductase [Oleiphilus sp. HI0069]KZY89296.1 arsenate reductase [Oleiphilus sp. HI0072]KZZ09460.1 arsenate reductase [Oleiphilus sp. HI0078]KZZ21383.1 arsenate reductase [Oleiphilus sp. HI0081]KZZ39723.1 arsenate reductase [Oleiphilus sp. HI0085]
MSQAPKKVLFLCTGNSCRSQMAEAWVNTIRNKEWQAYSAGIETHGMNPNAVSVMGELGVDMSKHYSKHIEELEAQQFDLIVTVCGHAAEHCPNLSEFKEIKHVPFDDPPSLAKLAANQEDELESYRRVRDEIRAFVESSSFSS